MALGLMWYAVCVFGPSVLHHHNLRGFAAVCSLGGVGFLLLGPASIRHLIFPMVFLVALVPVPMRWTSLNLQPEQHLLMGDHQRAPSLDGRL